MLHDRKIIITGSTRGIGRAIAEACIEQGAVIGVGYSRSNQEATELEGKYPKQVRLLNFDLRNPAEITQAISKFHSSEGKLDGLVNNAGICPSPGFLITADNSTIEDTIKVNLLGPIYCSKISIKYMAKQKFGSIINISSIAATRPTPGISWYSATKGGIESLTQALAIEYANRNIRVNSIRPGHMDTDMFDSFGKQFKAEVATQIPMKRVGKPTEISDLAIFLLSDKSSYITGSVFTADGGASIRG